jgi:hypothetical protein
MKNNKMKTNDKDHLDKEHLEQYMNLILDKRMQENRRSGNTFVPKEYKDSVESNKTAIIYIVNLILMILMCVFVVGIIIIYIIVLLEGSLYIDPIILVHLTIPSFVLALNLYIIMLEDREEERFFKKGNGFFILNFAFVAAIAALAITSVFKMMR